MPTPSGLVAINLNFGGFYHDPLVILDHIAYLSLFVSSLALVAVIYPPIPTLYHATFLWP